MTAEQKQCPCEFSVEETEEGYVIHLKGDKEKLKARMEALEAHRRFLSTIHKHIKAVHRRSHTAPAPEAAE